MYRPSDLTPECLNRDLIDLVGERNDATVDAMVAQAVDEQAQSLYRSGFEHLYVVIDARLLWQAINSKDLQTARRVQYDSSTRSGRVESAVGSHPITVVENLENRVLVLPLGATWDRTARDTWRYPTMNEEEI